MTVEELRIFCQRLETEGKGDMPVVWQSIRHTYDIELEETMRNGKPILLVNH